ncbi:hypothetical protein HAX54_020593 [Datura stramonium]|uniref:Uncharacterized protein n=1 Tax=Datura stramonium TaxID=4076 RepID=A0ABS8UTT5_DATST|nr:hypothetical protein [Datura stramonium]
MATKNQENGHGEPLIVKHDAHREELFMVYFSTAVAVCGSYAFGTCVGYSSPTQFSIMDELNLSFSQVYSSHYDLILTLIVFPLENNPSRLCGLHSDGLQF